MTPHRSRGGPVLGEASSNDGVVGCLNGRVRQMLAAPKPRKDYLWLMADITRSPSWARVKSVGSPMFPPVNMESLRFLMSLDYKYIRSHIRVNLHTFRLPCTRVTLHTFGLPCYAG
jgi:hypothetical protein